MPSITKQARLLKVIYWALVVLALAWMIYMGATEPGIVPSGLPGAAAAASQPCALTQPADGANHAGFFERLWVQISREFPQGRELTAKTASVVYRLLLTVVACAAAWGIIRVAQWMSCGVAARLRNTRPSAAGQIETIRLLLASTAKYAVVIAAALYVLGSIWGIDTSSLVVGTAVLGAALGFGSQGLIQDVITGISLLLESRVRVGDWAEIAGKNGLVESVGLRTTRLRAADGQLHIFFNRTIDRVSTYAGGAIRADVVVNLAAAADADRVAEVLREVARDARLRQRLAQPEPEISTLARADSAQLCLRASWGVVPSEQANFATEITARLEAALRERNIPLGAGGIRVVFAGRTDPSTLGPS